jgi:O-antigen/teichoic acid export membrane protein
MLSNNDDVGKASGHDPLVSWGGAELNVQWLAQRTAKGVFFTGSSRVTAILASLIGGIFLSRLLTPADFGLYAVVSFVVTQLGSLAQLGLNAALIHDRDQPSLRALRSVFALQTVNAVAFVAALWILSPRLAHVFGLPPQAAGFFHLVALGMLLQPFVSISTALLGRQLAYDRTASAQVAGTLAYQGVAVALAFAGFSFWSFGWAALASSVAQGAILYGLSPWRVGFAWDHKFLRRSIRFGGAFQLGSLTSLVRDNVIVFLGGPLFGPSVVGLLNWSQRLAEICSQEFVSICAGVSFPSLSRMRSDSAVFGTALSKMLSYVNLATLPSLSVTAALLPEIVAFVFGNKWAAAVPLFYYFAIRMVAGNFTTLLDSALKAQGRPGKSLVILSTWTAWEWALALAGIRLFGYSGIAMSYAIGGWLAAAWLYRETRKFAKVKLWESIGRPVLAALLTLCLLLIGKGHRITGLPSLFVAAIAGVLMYLLLTLAIGGSSLLREFRRDLSHMLARQKPDFAPVPKGDEASA